MNKLTPLKIKGVIKFKFRFNIIPIFKSSIVVKKLMQVNQVLIRKNLKVIGLLFILIEQLFHRTLDRMHDGTSEMLEK